MTAAGGTYPGTFVVTGTVWRYPGPGGWYFVTVDEAAASFIRNCGDVNRVGWGFVAVTARIGTTAWATKLFPDKERGYLLAIKAAVRKKERIQEGDAVSVAITLS